MHLMLQGGSKAKTLPRRPLPKLIAKICVDGVDTPLLSVLFLLFKDQEVMSVILFF